MTTHEPSERADTIKVLSDGALLFLALFFGIPAVIVVLALSALALGGLC